MIGDCETSRNWKWGLLYPVAREITPIMDFILRDIEDDAPCKDSQSVHKVEKIL